MIVEYKDDKLENLGVAAPSWLDRGGMFRDPDNYTSIGVVDTDHAHKVPDSVKVILSLDELKERLQELHTRHPFKDVADDTNLTTGEVDTLATDFYNNRDIGGTASPAALRVAQVVIDDSNSPYALRYATRTLLIDANTASVTVDIPTAVGCKGLRFTFINSTDSAANTVTLDGAGTEKLNGSETNTALDAQYDKLTIESDGANWLIVG